MVTSQEKRCCRCKNPFPRDSFHRNKGTPDGLHPECKNCRREQYKQSKEGQEMNNASHVSEPINENTSNQLSHSDFERHPDKETLKVAEREVQELIKAGKYSEATAASLKLQSLQAQMWQKANDTKELDACRKELKTLTEKIALLKEAHAELTAQRKKVRDAEAFFTATLDEVIL